MKEYARFAMVQPGNASADAVHEMEHSWISASQRGDVPAFNRLVLKWEKTVYNVAFRMLQNREEAAEATQEAFLLAFKNIRTFRRDCKFSTWIYRIVLNYCMTVIKQRPPGRHLSLEDKEDSGAPAPQLRFAETQLNEVMRVEQRNRVLSALSNLPPEQQAVIELKFFQELTFEEIAAALEVPLSTIKSRLYTGLEMLKIRLGNQSQ